MESMGDNDLKAMAYDAIAQIEQGQAVIRRVGEILRSRHGIVIAKEFEDRIPKGEASNETN